MDVFGDVNSSPPSPLSPNVGSPCCSTDNIHRRLRKREMEKTRQRRYRQRLRDSRDELQRQIDELTNELEQLGKRDLFESANTLLATSHWISQVTTERTKRTQSEAEHKRLLVAVNQQAVYIQRLCFVLKKRFNGVANDCKHGGGGRVAGSRSTPKPSLTPSVFYSMDLNQLEGCYAQVDAVRSSCGIMLMPETTINTTHRQDALGERTYFQHLSKMSIPYSFLQTVAALKTAVNEGSKTDAHVERVMKDRVLTSPFGGVVAQQFIARTYMEENRCVLVWKLLSRGKGAFSGLEAEETAWFVLRPTPTGVVIEVCARQVPTVRHSAQTLNVATEKFHNLLRDTLEKDRMQMAKRLEGLLLADILNGIDC
ncbi:hypothetical protein PsorP6_015009 [Peronosclerospora sorghi]|uniref:Uncharacterized protein n=1 Tax=Peronosclerospora sorghi TaxID=230839 RepID=A0ACC0VSD2_9STRA|nr:hypothetical protein PsorP6_015009 [Peronosclerospora sorghi]